MAKPDSEHNTNRKHPSPGDAQGVPVPHDQAMEGTSEQFQAEDSVVSRAAGKSTKDDLPTAGDFKSLP